MAIDRQVCLAVCSHFAAQLCWVPPTSWLFLSLCVYSLSIFSVFSASHSMDTTESQQDEQDDDNHGDELDAARPENELGCSPSPPFDIPELPSGSVLLLELLSSWGDQSLVGLSAIELFAVDGTRPPVGEVTTNAAETVEGELGGIVVEGGGEEDEDEGEGEGDGMNMDEAEGERSRKPAARGPWLCRYRAESRPESDSESSPSAAADQCAPVQIAIRFRTVQTLAMIRIWNYAGSRVHSLRGVRHLRIWLDAHCIFRGEICCAYSLGAAAPSSDAPNGDTILFTTNEEILAKIAEHDGTMAKMEEEEEGRGRMDDEMVEDEGDEEGKEEKEKRMMPQMAKDGKGPHAAECPRLAVVSSAFCRPTTGHSSPSSSASSSAAGNRQGTAPKQSAEEKRKEEAEEGEAEAENEEEEEEKESVITGRVFHMELLANWGCPDAVGLTGIQFLGPRFEPIDERTAGECVVRCEPEDEEEDGGTLSKILNGRNLTSRAGEMWLSSVWAQQGPAPMLSFTFPTDIRISGISVWNYNASPELSYAGVRCARFYANGRPLSLGVVLLRKAPGAVFFDFVQDVLFDRCPLVRPPSCPRPQTRSIAAFIFQLRLLSSWGDEFYIGLNGIELFGRHDRPLRLLPRQLAAFPESVNCLRAPDPGVPPDPRSSGKLIDGINDTAKAHHMWLTPMLPNSCARVFVIFDAPTFVTRIRIYNYRKTPSRGVRHIALSADDLLLCSGAEVPMSTAQHTGFLDIPLRDVDQ